MNEDGTFTQCWKNLTIKDTLSPKWAEAKIAMTTLCNGDLDRPLRITIYDHESSGKHVFMGQVDTSVRAMLKANGSPLNVIEPEKKDKSGYTNSGTLMASHCAIEHHPTFSDVSLLNLTFFAFLYNNYDYHFLCVVYCRWMRDVFGCCC